MAITASALIATKPLKLFLKLLFLNSYKQHMNLWGTKHCSVEMEGKKTLRISKAGSNSCWNKADKFRIHVKCQQLLWSHQSWFGSRLLNPTGIPAGFETLGPLHHQEKIISRKVWTTSGGYWEGEMVQGKRNGENKENFGTSNLRVLLG